MMELNEQSPRYEPIKRDQLKIVPKEHQKASLHAMRTLETRNLETDTIRFETNMGILNDPVGYGKTITMLMHLLETDALSLHNRFIPTRSDRYGNMSIFRRPHYNFTYLPIQVILVPKGVVHQWIHTLNTQVLIPYTAILMTKDIIEFGKMDLTRPHLYLVTETRFKSFMANIDHRYEFGRWEIDRFVIDEFDTVDVKAFPGVQARFSWFISGSTHVFKEPEYYIRNNGYLKNLLMDLRGSPLGLVRVRNTMDFLQMSHSLPPPVIHRYVIRDNSHIRAVRGLVSDSILRSLQAGDVTSAVQELGIAKENATNIVDALTQSFQRDLHNLKIKRQEREQYEYANDNAKKEALLKLDQQILEMTDKIADLQKRIQEEDCPICYSQPEHPVVLQCCHHRYCVECLIYSFRAMNNQRCPMCRTEADVQSLTYLNSGDSSAVASSSCAPKILNRSEKIDELFDQYPHGKWLIVSEYDASFRQMCRIMDNHQPPIQYHEPKGTADTIHKYVEQFKSGKCPVLLLNASRYASGIHLPETTDIVFYHTMSQDIEMQVIGRAQRIGRTSPLRIHYFDVE